MPGETRTSTDVGSTFHRHLIQNVGRTDRSLEDYGVEYPENDADFEKVWELYDSENFTDPAKFLNLPWKYWNTAAETSNQAREEFLESETIFYAEFESKQKEKIRLEYKWSPENAAWEGSRSPEIWFEAWRQLDRASGGLPYETLERQIEGWPFNGMEIQL